MLRVLRGASRLARQQAKAADACQSRAFAAAGAEVAIADESPFLRYATPVPQPYSFANLLGSIPATQVIHLCFIEMIKLLALAKSSVQLIDPSIIRSLLH
jgi:hypothetical protein